MPQPSSYTGLKQVLRAGGGGERWSSSAVLLNSALARWTPHSVHSGTAAAGYALVQGQNRVVWGGISLCRVWVAETHPHCWQLTAST